MFRLEHEVRLEIPLFFKYCLRIRQLSFYTYCKKTIQYENIFENYSKYANLIKEVNAGIMILFSNLYVILCEKRKKPFIIVSVISFHVFAF